MDEAIRIVPPQPSAVIFTLAKRAAIKAVKRELHTRDRKLSSMSQSEIVALANDHLAQHRQALIVEAAEIVRKVPELRTLYEREQRDRRRNRR